MIHEKSVKVNNDQEMPTWVAQLVEHLTLDFGSDHDLRVLGWSPEEGLQGICLSIYPSVYPFSLSLSLSTK